MFSYNVYKESSNEEFNKVCKRIENSLNIKKEPPLIDVDGSIIQVYLQGSKKIKVYNDCEVDAVYVDSEIELNNLFAC